jgi:hypothetical protein
MRHDLTLAEIVKWSCNISRVRIVPRRSKSGYRIILYLTSGSGMPIIETLRKSFETLQVARQFSISEFGIEAQAIGSIA